MPFITFIYKIKGVPQTYYGKYDFDYMSDDHEGLDLEIINVLSYGLNKYRQKNSIPKIDNKDIIVGILSYSDHRIIPIYSTKDEIKCFDFYCLEYDSNSDKIKYYVYGEEI
jgi:hypothetical protein